MKSKCPSTSVKKDFLASALDTDCFTFEYESSDCAVSNGGTYHPLSFPTPVHKVAIYKYIAPTVMHYAKLYKNTTGIEPNFIYSSGVTPDGTVGVDGCQHWYFTLRFDRK
jgi:hypothetical protein